MDIPETLQKVIHSNNYWKHADFVSVLDTLSFHFDNNIEIDTEKIAVLHLQGKTHWIDLSESSSDLYRKEILLSIP